MIDCKLIDAESVTKCLIDSRYRIIVKKIKFPQSQSS